MASEPRTQTQDELADEIVCKIDAYLEGSLSAEEVSSWARPFLLREWQPGQDILEDATAALTFLGPGEYDTSTEELREFRSYLMDEKDYVVHHRFVRRRNA